MNLSKLFNTVLAVCFFQTVHSQLRINVSVQDSKGNPIPYATALNSKSHYGAVTNEDGQFELNAQPNDSIFIRCLGYEEYKCIAGQLQNTDIVILKNASFELNEVVITPNLNDAKKIVQKFRANIKRNYPKKPVQIGGIYKDYSRINDEYSSFFQCDMDILVNSIALNRRPSFKTKFHGHKSFRNPDVGNKGGNINPDYSYSRFCIFQYSFLRNTKNYQFHTIGYTAYNNAKLVQVDFSPKQADKSKKQYTGSMFIDIKTHALVYLQYKLVPNEIDFSFNDKGYWQKLIQEENKIMFELNNGLYFPAYVISRISGKIDTSDRNTVSNHKDEYCFESVYNFFTKNVEYNPKFFIEDNYSIRHLIYNSKLDWSDYKSNFILETEKEKQLFDYLK